MFNNSIDNKPFFTKDDGTMLKDLTKSMFNFSIENNDVPIYNLYKVPKQYVMRPDLISQAVYGDTKYAEIILKFNGISNALTINEGDIIVVPPLESAQKQIAPSGQAADAANKIRKSYLYIDPLKIPKRSAMVTDFEKLNKDLANALPPNIAPEGATQIEYTNGRVQFGTNIGIPANKCLKNGQTISEFITIVNKSK